MPVTLATVAYPVDYHSRRDVSTFSGEFTGANNADPTGVKMKGNFTVKRTGEGVYRFQAVNKAGTAVKGFSLVDFNLLCINPASTDGGSGPWFISDDSCVSAGHFDVTTQNQAFAAADILVLAKCKIILSPEAAS
jgi:hypothetical protein